MKSQYGANVVLEGDEKLILLTELRSIFLRTEVKDGSVKVEKVYPKLCELKHILDVQHIS